MMSRRTTAPISASMIAAMMPAPRLMPIAGRRYPAMIGTHDADHDVADDPEAAALDQQAGQPAGDTAHDDPRDD